MARARLLWAAGAAIALTGTASAGAVGSVTERIQLRSASDHTRRSWELEHERVASAGVLLANALGSAGAQVGVCRAMSSVDGSEFTAEARWKAG